MPGDNHHALLVKQALGKLLYRAGAAPFGEGDRASLGQVAGEFVAVLREKSGGNGRVFADDVEIALDNPLSVLQDDDAQDFGWG
jgi:hypothetical protein